jgi:hypothetical protein
MEEAQRVRTWRENLPRLLTGALVSWYTLGGVKELEEM